MSLQKAIGTRQEAQVCDFKQNMCDLYIEALERNNIALSDMYGSQSVLIELDDLSGAVDSFIRLLDSEIRQLRTKITVFETSYWEDYDDD